MLSPDAPSHDGLSPDTSSVGTARFYAPLELLRQTLMGDKEQPGIFAQTTGFKTSTTAIKGVHIINDVAQTVLGGRPGHRGDFLARVVRQNHVAEQNDDRRLRAHPAFGDDYQHAFPEDLSEAHRYALRHALETVVTFDGGIYQPSTAMASGLVAFKDLLGDEGFRRFGVGAFMARLLGPVGMEQLRALLNDPSDPMTRLLAPLCIDSEWKSAEVHSEGHGAASRESSPLSTFDLALSLRLQQLLRQPLSKLTRLRFLLLGFTLGLQLRLLGQGRPGGHPIVLASVPLPGGASRPAREEAIQAFSSGLTLHHRVLAQSLLAHPNAQQLFARSPVREHRCLSFVALDTPLARAGALLDAASEYRWGSEERRLYWPEDFMVALGRKAGLVMPQRDHGGWGKHLSLTPDALEALIMMFVPAGQTLPWKTLWEQVAEELGLLIGVGEDADRARLRDAGMLQLRSEALEQCASNALTIALDRGLARRLPDEGAEVSGSLA